MLNYQRVSRENPAYIGDLSFAVAHKKIVSRRIGPYEATISTVGTTVDEGSTSIWVNFITTALFSRALGIMVN